MLKEESTVLFNCLFVKGKIILYACHDQFVFKHYSHRSVLSAPLTQASNLNLASKSKIDAR